MQSIEVLESVEYTLGWSYCSRAHINLGTSSCCPLSMFLLKNSLIDRDTTWLVALNFGLKIFNRDELEGFLDGVDNQKMRLNNYLSVKGYALGYATGKKVRLKFESVQEA